MQPTIRHIKQNVLFKYLWLKYVTGVNLDVHCARCLVGPYSKRISPNLQEQHDVALSEFDGKYYYLCGVSSPYRWERNFHLAFRYKQGETLRVNENGIEIEIENAERVPIVKWSSYEHPKGVNSAYNTCRNWQFANIIAGDFNPIQYDRTRQ